MLLSKIVRWFSEMSTPRRAIVRRRRQLFAERLENRALLAAVATMIEDAVPSGGINPVGLNSNPLFLTDVNGTLYFRANDGTNGNELWRINASGQAEMVEDALPGGGINQGASDSNPSFLTIVNNTLYFEANDESNGRELWRIDASGKAEMVEDAVPGGGINSGGSSFSPFFFPFLTNVSGTLYFAASDDNNGRELWRINASGKAEMVEDAVPDGGINPGASESFPARLTNFNGTLYFSAQEGSSGHELWRINASGKAEMVEDATSDGGIRPGNIGSNPFSITNVNGTLYFGANDGRNGSELWRINASDQAEMVEDAVLDGGIGPGSSGSAPFYLRNVNGTLYFTANDGTNGNELWRVNASFKAEMVEDAIPGGGIRPGVGDSSPSNSTTVNGTLYFTANDGSNGFELWRINASGLAEMIEDSVPGGGINPGVSDSRRLSPMNVNGTLYFSADDGNNGYELWRINAFGLAEMIEDAVPGVGISPGVSGSSPYYLTNVNGTLYFSAEEPNNGRELWRINASGLAEMVATNPSAGIHPGAGDSYPRLLTTIDRTLYFQASDGRNGVELWKVVDTCNTRVTQTGDSGPGSLREAITCANTTPGTQTINFNIPGAGTQTITPLSALPTITGPVIIDGTTQPGFSSAPLIELNGASAGAGVSGLKITAGSSTVRGLAINRFKGAGIELRTRGNNIVSGNRIGTNAAGTLDRGNIGVGVLIINSASNTIGGTTAATRNVISGNDQSGVSITGASATGNLVRGNFVGMNAAGTLAIANSLDGILINGASSNTIGGTAVSTANTIAFNGRDGVRILGTAVGNKIQRNSLFSNVALGIDLSGNGVTANDTNDADAGPNKQQNFPAIISALRSGANLTVTYSVPSTAANSTFPLRVEFYIADTAKQEGKTFLQAASYTSAGRKIITFPAGAASAGSRIVATATDASGNTSEFSASRAVTSPLLALNGEASAPGSQPPTLTSAQLQPIVNAAIARLTSQGLNSAQVQTLSSVKFNIASLSGATLGLAGDTFITLDSNAAGYGWYIDATPLDDLEFGVRNLKSQIPNLKSQIANPKLMDLLTTVMHELGHILGDSDLDPETHPDELMSGTLSTGVRHTSHLGALDSFFARQKRFI